ncbi:toxin C-terminal domain-containing protein, partial [Streptomyces sp. NPDC005786]|uniref:toxin C-terminal domain-containing protein n=3 Tax=unclassified Streptomyces TaxID=2593676 RepID=UPI0033E7EAE5
KHGGDLYDGLKGLLKSRKKVKDAEKALQDAGKKLDDTKKDPPKKDKPEEKKPPTCDVKHSFPPGTRVLLADGRAVPIEAVRAGDRVEATDPAGGLTRARRVERLITTYDDKDFTRLVVRTAGGPAALTATDTHPFWVVGQRGWTDAGDITPGMELRSPDGSVLSVAGVSRYTQRRTTHDLTVNGLHTYYVLAGQTPVLVHNDNCNSLTRKQADDVADYLGYTKTNKRSAGGAPIWENKKATGGQPRYITYDRTGHNKQAVFKGANFRNPFQSTKDSARDGTYGLDVSPDGKVLGLKWLAK